VVCIGDSCLPDIGGVGTDIKGFVASGNSASKRAKPSYRQLTINHGTVANCLAVRGIDRMACRLDGRSLGRTQPLHSDGSSIVLQLVGKKSTESVDLEVRI
jgi:hypothetical protein